MPQRYKVAKGDMFLQSKRADESFVFEKGFALFFYDRPKKGKATVVEYMPYNFPAVTVYVTANWKARLDSRSIKNDPLAIQERF